MPLSASVGDLKAEACQEMSVGADSDVRLLLGSAVLDDAAQTLAECGVEAGSNLSIVLQKTVWVDKMVGEWKCWWSDMREVFVIEKTGDDRLTVTVHDERVGPRGRPGQVDDIGEGSVLVWRFQAAGRLFCTEYRIDWQESPLRMTLQDKGADGAAYNSEWGWVVPATEDFQCH